MNKLITFIILIVLTISAFFIRLDNFKKSRGRTIDEIVYYCLGRQLKYDFPEYHSKEYAYLLMRQGRELPAYFTAPLFKHPPVVPFLISFSLRFFGDNLTAAGYIPLLFGVLMIPLTYWLGSLLFNYKVGLLSAFFVSIDPVSIICSQKVWMDSPLSFFVLLTIVLFIWGIKSKNNNLFILSGFVCGLAAATKYPGILAMVSIPLYAYIYRRNLFKDRKFCLGIIMPFIVLVPWFYWNYLIYGSDFFIIHKNIHGHNHLHGKVGIILIALGIIYLLHKRIEIIPLKNIFAKIKQNNYVKKRIPVWCGCLFFASVFMQIAHGLQFTYLPLNTWYPGVFGYEPSTFYFGRLIEFSLIYVFAFLSFFLPGGKKNEEKALLRISSLVILSFFIAWRNFQCRYILASIPFLIILAVELIVRLYEKTSLVKKFLPRNLSRFGLIMSLYYIFAKTCYINQVLSYPNDLCYF